MLCEAMLQNIIKGMAAIGSNTCRRMAPAAAENAKPENPLTKPPRKTAVESIASSTGACIRVPRDGRELAGDVAREPNGECSSGVLPQLKPLITARNAEHDRNSYDCDRE